MRTSFLPFVCGLGGEDLAGNETRETVEVIVGHLDGRPVPLHPG